VFNFTHFNRLQTDAFDDLYKSDENLVICAPTAAGKTVLMELGILRNL